MKWNVYILLREKYAKINKYIADCVRLSEFDNIWRILSLNCYYFSSMNNKY